MRLCQELSALAKTHIITIVPGGGEFADTVREFDKRYNLSDAVAHKMAILAMDQYGLLLSSITPNSYISYSLEEISNPMKGSLPILLPSKLIFHKDPMEHSWDVTSDTIAAYIAQLLHAEKLMVVTDVDGIFFQDPKKSLDVKLVEDLSAKELLGWNRRTSVDKALPKMLLETNLDTYVVNGRYPKRIRLILKNRKTVCTHITV
jgi:aspartokinase-like uncharacterized kinase